MSKLTKAEYKAHEEAVALLSQDALTIDERIFVLDNWQESATNVNSAAGAFFTPFALARDLAIEIGGTKRIIDLCAGIGSLSLAAHLYWPDSEIVCVEINPQYVEVGRRILPEATWVEASVFNMPPTGRFGVAISNPPFGNVKRDGDSPTYTGRNFEFHVASIASTIAREGVFIVPQMSAPFEYSGKLRYAERESRAHDQFQKQTGLCFEPNCGIDTEPYRSQWRGTAPITEIVLCDFEPDFELEAG